MPRAVGALDPAHKPDGNGLDMAACVEERIAVDRRVELSSNCCVASCSIRCFTFTAYIRTQHDVWQGKKGLGW